MLTQSIENVLNRNLSQSPRARQLCGELTGKRLRVSATGAGWQLDMESLCTSLKLTSRRSAETDGSAPDDSPEIHATIAGTPLSLVALAGAAATAVIQRGDVQIDGDAEVAEKFQQVLQLLRPDAEEELSRLIGDSPARQLLRLARGALAFGERATRTTVRNTAEFFAHESRDLVPKAEAEDLYSGIDRLREDLDRLDARIAQLDSANDTAQKAAP
ncbi:MAG: SCP2 sterol-binding domain-containing protein [Proteobacteria bacterium]|jgi:ubiquinone biosynthesis protein UbiJ|nr:SCP2 sterol-binding domain-containing protein [Pseudomonadota bacterium]